MAKVRGGLAKHKRECEAHQGSFESWCNSSPWLTTLISTVWSVLYPGHVTDFRALYFKQVSAVYERETGSHPNAGHVDSLWPLHIEIIEFEGFHDWNV